MAYKKNNNQQQAKKTGCSMKTSYVSRKTGEVVNAPVIFGWNSTKRRGMVKFVAVPNRDSGTASDTQERWTAKITGDMLPLPVTASCFYNTRTGKLSMPDVFGGMVANPQTDFWGRNFKAKN